MTANTNSNILRLVTALLAVALCFPFAACSAGGSLSSEGNNQLTVEAAPTPEGAVDSDYSYLASVSGGTPPYAFQLAQGSLPPGLTLTPSGQINGRPTVQGSYSFTIQAVDSSTPQMLGSTTTTIAIGAPPPSTFQVVTARTATASVGQAYDEPIVATGGTGPYAFSIADGVLPTGVVLDSQSGRLTGTPVRTGVYPITVRVAESGGATPIDRPLNLAVQSAPGQGGLPTVAVTLSRRTGVAPLSVFFDATGTSAAGVAKPFHHLGYHWDFDDVNSRHRQSTGPVAAHVFDAPGSYTVRLTVIKNGVSAVTHTEVITVTDPDTVFAGNNTICFSNDSSFPEAPAGSTQITTRSFDTAMSHYQAGRRLLFERGDTFESRNPSGITASGATILGAFGTGVNPDARGIFSNNPIILARDNSTILNVRGENLRVMDLRFVEASGVQSDGVFNTSGRLQLALAYRLHIEGFHDAIMINHSVVQYSSIDPHRANTVADCHTVNTRNYPFFGGGTELGIIGNRFDRSITHHVVRVTFADNFALDSNQIYYPKVGDHAIKLHASQDTARYGQYTQNVVIRCNEIKTDVAWPVALSPRDELVNEFLRDVIFESNRVLAEDGTLTSVYVSGADITVRCNEFVTLSNSANFFSPIRITQRGVGPVPRGVEVYNNTYYNDVGGNVFESMVEINDHIGAVIVKNNLMHAPNGTASAVRGPGSSTTGSNLINVAAGFADPANMDFSLTPGSAALGAGESAPVSFDYRGFSRIQQSVGAHDF